MKENLVNSELDKNWMIYIKITKAQNFNLGTEKATKWHGAESNLVKRVWHKLQNSRNKILKGFFGLNIEIVRNSYAFISLFYS